MVFYLIIKVEGREVRAGLEYRRNFAIKFFGQSRRVRETHFHPPIARVEHGQIERLISPGVVEIEMKSLAQNYFRGRDPNRESLALAVRRFSASSVRFGSTCKAASYWMMAYDVLPSRSSKLSTLLSTSA